MDLHQELQMHKIYKEKEDKLINLNETRLNNKAKLKNSKIKLINNKIKLKNNKVK